MSARTRFWHYADRSFAFVITLACTSQIGYSANQGPSQQIGGPDFTAVRKEIQAVVSDNIAPGVGVLVAQNGKVILKEALGNLSVDSSLPVASITKSAVATTVMILVEQHKLSLEDPITKSLPEFRGTPIEKATVRQLLSHSSGVIAMSNPSLPPGTLPARRSRPATHAELAQDVARYAYLSNPGEFHYTDTNYDLICAIAEKTVSPMESLIRKTLFEPLGMNSRFSSPPPNMCIWCGGGLVASLDDLWALYQMHLDRGIYKSKRILSSDSIREMHKKQAAGELSTLGPGTFEYGLGFFRDRVMPDGEARTIYHSGHVGSLAWVDFDLGLVGVLFLNTEKEGWRPAAQRIQGLIRKTVPPPGW